MNKLIYVVVIVALLYVASAQNVNSQPQSVAPVKTSCMQDSDCTCSGQTVFTSKLFCSSNTTVSKEIKTYECVNGFCEKSVTTPVIRECVGSCSNGICEGTLSWILK